MARPVLAALFVPGSRPDRFEKAVQSGADAVIIDLEDAVAPAEKEKARSAIAEWLRVSRPDLEHLIIRINPVDSPEFFSDSELLASLRREHTMPHTVMVPKAECAAGLDQITSLLADSTAFVALVESATGLLNITEIANHPRVERLGFGAADYAADVGCALTNTSLLLPRSLISVVSASAGLLPPLDTPCFTIEDSVALQEHAQNGRELGFGGSLCIHPAQIRPIRQGYLPSETEIEWATSILTNAPAAGASRVDGDMVDAPVLKRAERIIHASESE